MKKKRIFPLILSLLLIMGAVPAAAEEEPSDISTTDSQETVQGRDPNLPESY